MPIILELEDLSRAFRQLEEPPIILNDLPLNTDEARESIKELITTRYSSDMITLLPSCRCGYTKGEFSTKHDCVICGCPVKSVMAGSTESIVWVRKPDGIDALMHPHIYHMLTDKFKKGSYSLIDWIIDTKYNPNTKVPVAIINKMIDNGIQQGYNYFVNNFDQIMRFMFSMDEFKPKADYNKHDRLYELIQKYRHVVFCDYIPIPNKSILIIEKTVFSKYVDQITTDALDAILTLVSIDKDYYDQSIRAKENRVARGQSMLRDFYQAFDSDSVASKTGMIRRHGLGTRTNWSGRAVITSVTGTHDYRDIEIPWGVGLTILREHLLNKLEKMGMSMNSGLSLIYSHIEKYSPLLDKLMTEIKNEFPGGKIPLLLNRNPSLLQGSILALLGGTIKKNPKDRTFGLSILCVKSLNADFDGDEVHISLMLDNEMAAAIYSLEPKFSIWGMNKPLSISGNVSLSKPVGAAISNFLMH